jgi:hypothetical protein
MSQMQTQTTNGLYAAVTVDNLPATTNKNIINKNILTLGGSTTWGSKLDNRQDAYPYLLPSLLGTTTTTTSWRVYNLAVRATDASYASQCVESMIREGLPGNNNNNKVNTTTTTTTTTTTIQFDVITLEYSLNGLDGMPLLLQRLRQRYPNAVIIYIHLWSLRMSVDNAETGIKPRDELTKSGLTFKDADANINAMLADPNNNAKWKWAPKMKSDSIAIREAAEQDVRVVNGHVYQLPMPEESPQIAFQQHWFGPDFHHLSKEGHALVAGHLAQMLQDEKIMGGGGSSSSSSSSIRQDIHDITISSTEEGIGSWGAGDHCYSWYETGTHPDVQVDGGTVKNFVKPDKWAVNVGLTFGQPANIHFPNKKHLAQPVMLMIMSWGPGVYPKARIKLVAPGFVNQTSILDPLHPSPLNQVYHVTRSAHVGWVNAQSPDNIIIVDPIENMQRPLRVIGIIMCGACLEMDPSYLSNDVRHQRLGGTLPYPQQQHPITQQQQQQQQPDHGSRLEYHTHHHHHTEEQADGLQQDQSTAMNVGLPQPMQHQPDPSQAINVPPQQQQQPMGTSQRDQQISQQVQHQPDPSSRAMNPPRPQQQQSVEIPGQYQPGGNQQMHSLSTQQQFPLQQDITVVEQSQQQQQHPPAVQIQPPKSTQLQIDDYKADVETALDDTFTAESSARQYQLRAHASAQQAAPKQGNDEASTMRRALQSVPHQP